MLQCELCYRKNSWRSATWRPVTSESKVNDPLKVLAIGLTETYSHMAPWHVIMGQSFGASITYQLDAGKFTKWDVQLKSASKIRELEIEQTTHLYHTWLPHLIFSLI